MTAAVDIKTPARKAPAKKAAPAKAAPKAPPPAARKLRWKLAAEKVNNQQVEQTAETEGHTYAITRSGEGWKATVKVDGGKPTVLVDGTFAKAYNACVQHDRAR